MESENVIQSEAEYVLQTYKRPDIVFSHGNGSYLFDYAGKRYLDFTSGIAVTSLGHSDKAWAEAVARQAATLTHVSNLFHTAPQAVLAKKLVRNSFADRVFFCNSGAEANEAAIKFARKFARSRRQEWGGTRIVAFSGGFHGRTVGALSVTFKAQYREPFAPLMPDVEFAEFNDLGSAQSAVDGSTCAVIVEPVQGEGGVKPASLEFLQGLRELCNARGALLIFDEVQCGLARTGHLWAHQAYEVQPDIMTLAKPLAGGLPIGATLVTQAVADVIEPGDHGSTFAAGPLVCSAANVVFDRVSQPDFLAHVAHEGDYLQHRLRTLESEELLDVRGAGLLIGMQMKTPVAPLIRHARDNGLLILSAGEDVIRMAPPLTVSRSEIDEAVSMLEQCLDTVTA